MLTTESLAFLVEVKNDNLDLPMDLLLPLAVTLVWATLHWSLRAWVFKVQRH